MHPRRRRLDSRGLTIIELMIVVAILGIISAIAIPNFIAFRNKAFCSQAESDALSVAAAVSDYFSEPDHTTLCSLGDLSGIGSISATISGSIEEIIITVSDPGGCPRGDVYRLTIPEDPSNDGWSSAARISKLPSLSVKAQILAIDQ